MTSTTTRVSLTPEQAQELLMEMGYFGPIDDSSFVLRADHARRNSNKKAMHACDRIADALGNDLVEAAAAIYEDRRSK